MKDSNEETHEVIRRAGKLAGIRGNLVLFERLLEQEPQNERLKVIVENLRLEEQEALKQK